MNEKIKQISILFIFINSKELSRSFRNKGWAQANHSLTFRG